MRAAVDTDVIIRLLTGDDLGKQALARALFDAAAKGDVDLLVTSTVVADAVFVLTSPRLYSVRREDAAEMLLSLLTLPGVETEHEERTLGALELFRSSGMDFGDAYLAAFAMELEEPLVYSFDRDFDRVSGLRRLEP